MEKITFGDNLPGYVCGPKGAPGLLVLQEWWGITPEIQEHAKVYSEICGFRCLVPDLYKGKIGVDKEEASHLMSKLDWVQAFGEMKQAAEYLRSEGSAKVGAVGFCMGGALSLCAAQHSGIDAAVPFYGCPGEEACDPSKLTVPVQGHFGADDPMKGFSDVDTAKALDAKLKASPGKGEVFIYEGESHAFMNRTDEENTKKREMMGFTTPKPENQKLARERSAEFLKKALA
ncbi:unnamed protein product [Pedinophyceae sp. YPF-701]|nr:unnamed protein product [Pedinophyceae sp. YPF-701]